MLLWDAAHAQLDRTFMCGFDGARHDFDDRQGIRIQAALYRLPEVSLPSALGAASMYPGHSPDSRSRKRRHPGKYVNQLR